MALSMPIEHPARFAAIEQISNQLGGFSREERQMFPEYLVPHVEAFGKQISARGLNPFADAFSLIRPDKTGLMASLAPQVEAGVRFIGRVPETPFGPQETGPIGFPEPIIGLEDLVVSSAADLPAPRLIRDLIQGDSLKSRPESAAAFFGVNIRNPEQIRRAQERLIRTQKTAIRSQQRAPSALEAPLIRLGVRQDPRRQSRTPSRTSQIRLLSQIQGRS